MSTPSPRAAGRARRGRAAAGRRRRDRGRRPHARRVRAPGTPPGRASASGRRRRRRPGGAARRRPSVARLLRARHPQRSRGRGAGGGGGCAGAGAARRSGRLDRPRAISAPAPLPGRPAWLLENVDLLRPGMRVLDVAAGRGRHALLFAAAGFRRHGRRSRRGRPVQAAGRRARPWACRCARECRTSRSADVDLGDGVYDLVAGHQLPAPAAHAGAVSRGGARRAC